jgi:hypothetical protein
MPRGGARSNTGGARPGAGRPKGSRNKKTRESLEMARASGLTPLEVMLHTMRWYFEAERFDEASNIAAMAAPYVHPKLAATAVVSPGNERDRIRRVEYIIIDPKDPDLLSAPEASDAEMPGR